MKVQQIAIYESLNAFMVAIGYQNAADRRDDDPVWSTLNENNYRAMMEYKFGQPRNEILVPTSLELVHPFIKEHSAWEYREDLEYEDGEEAPVVVAQIPLTTPDGFARGTTEYGLWLRAGSPAEWTAPTPTEPPAPAPAPAEPAAATPAAPEVIEEITQEFQAEQQQEQPAVEEKTEEQPEQEQPAEEGGDSEQE
jgi:hypothetical protein